jgi:DNA polymerase, archaea type
MAKYLINTPESFQEFMDYVRENDWEQIVINTYRDGKEFLVLEDGNEYCLSYDPKVYSDYAKQSNSNPNQLKYDPVIFGKDQTENIVSVVAEETTAYIYREVDGKVTCDVKVAKPWIIGTGKPKMGGKSLNGNLFYKYFKEFDSFEEYKKTKGMMYGKGLEFYSVNDLGEAYMATSGVTYFKGMKFEDVSVLSFDIETTGLHADAPDAKVLLISNTYRNSAGKIEKRMFSIDDYSYETELLLAWESYVQYKNPSIIIGHNIYGFDLPYLNTRMDQLGQRSLILGRDNSNIKFAEKPSRKRKDGSQEYDYFKVRIHGREVIDTWFLSINYDNVRKQYPSLGLKQIIKWEYDHALELGDQMSNLQKRLCNLQKSRVFYDGGKIRDNWDNLEERAKIKKYCQDDSDEALFLYDLMAPGVFYQTQSMPKTFQAMTESAAGTQINSLMVRNYLQEGHSLPRADEQQAYVGAISFGIPGRYANTAKWDVASLYPSIMIQYEVCDIKKDPKKYFLRVVKYFTEERLKNKKLAKETGEQYYLDMSEGQKITINSMYGFLGSKGLLFNSPSWAAFITEKGREILNIACEWATGKNLEYWKNKVTEEGEPDAKED